MAVPRPIRLAQKAQSKGRTMGSIHFLRMLIYLCCFYRIKSFSPSFESHKGRCRTTNDGDVRATLFLSTEKDRPASTSESTKDLTHKKLLWKIRPTPETSWFERLKYRVAANLVRLECRLTGKKLPTILCPAGGKAVLEAWKQADGKNAAWIKIGRFGITTEVGPSAPEIQKTVDEIYGVGADRLVRTAAIIFMFVDEEYRKQTVGVLALEVISLIHAVQGCDFSVLVADDNGSGKLVTWYQKHGFSKAPRLQEVFGSPGGKYGVTMIAPTKGVLPRDCNIQWW